MIRRHHQLGTTVWKTTEGARLWGSERGIVEIEKNTLAIPIMLDNQERGYIFRGHCKLLLDTIVETEEGAIGKPIEREMDKAFLMLGDIEEIRQHFSEAGKEDFAEMGCETRQAFTKEAEDLFNRFFRSRETQDQPRFSKHRGFIFAFQNQNDALDILVAKGPKLVYTTKDLVFVSKENKVVLKSPDEVVCSSNGKSLIIDKGRSVRFKR